MEYKLIDNAYNSIGKSLRDSSQESFFLSSLRLYDSMKSLYDSLITSSEAEDKGLDLLDVQDDQTVALEALDGFSEFKELSYIGNSSPFLQDGHNEHFRNAIATSESILETISDIVMAGGILSDESVEKLKPPVYYVVSELAYCLLYSFGLASIAVAVQKNERPEVQVQVMKVLNNHRIDPVELAQSVVKASEEFRVTLKVFEKFPDLEETFYDSVGIYFDQFIRNEEYLTEDFVLRVVSKDDDLEKVVADFLEHVSKEKAKEIVLE